MLKKLNSKHILTYIMYTILVVVYTFFFYVVPLNTAGEDLAEQTAAFAGQQGAGIETSRDVREVAALIIRGALGLVGTLFLGYAIYGGYLIMVSRGNDEQVNKGKKTLLTAVIGVIVVLSAYAITIAVARILMPERYDTGVDVWVEPDYSDYYHNDPLRDNPDELVPFDAF